MKIAQTIRKKDSEYDTEVKRLKNLEAKGITEVKVLSHERWRKLGSLIYGVIVR
jgi:hypothetical protein